MGGCDCECAGRACRCRQACEDMHKLARERMEHQVRSEMFADKQEVILKYEEQLHSTRY